MVNKSYKCKECGLEITRPFNMNEELKQCDNCKGEVERVWKPLPVSWKCEGATKRRYT